MAAKDPPLEQLEVCLLALAVAGGNAAEANEHLRLLDPPVAVAESTLRRWKVKYANRYSEIQADRAPLIESIALEQVREAILQAGKLQARVLEKLLERMERGDVEPKDLATILKAAGVSLGINVEKMLLLTNRPTVIAEKRDVAELLQSLAKRVPGLIEADGFEIDDSKGLGTPKGDPEGSPDTA